MHAKVLKARRAAVLLLLASPLLAFGAMAALQGCVANVPSLAFFPTPVPVGSTPTPTPCASGSLMPLYGFESDTQCWVGEFEAVAYPVSVSTTMARTGNQSMQMVAPFLNGSQRTATFRLTFGTPVDLTGKTISAWVYVPYAALGGGVGASPMFVMSNGFCWEDDGNWYGFNQADQWVQLSFTPTWVPGACTPNSTLVEAIGFNLVSSTTATTGPATLYVDDVTITP
jgi:hypothetical protein